MSRDKPGKIAVFISQRILTRYREDAFHELSLRQALDVFVAFGDRSRRRPFAKYSSIATPPRMPHVRLRTLSLIFERFGHVNQLFFSPGVLLHLLRRRPDVVLTEGASNILNNLLICSYCLLSGTPYVWWDLGRIRGQDSQSIFRRLLSPLIRFFARRATVVLGYSSFAVDHFLALGIPEARIMIAGNAVRLDGHLSCQRSRGDEAAALAADLGIGGCFVFLAVGGLEKAKRFDLLVLAFQTLAREHGEARLIIVGDGPELSALRELSRVAAPEKIHLAGAHFEDVGLYFMNADCLCQPGLGGLVLNEAMAYGVPVIAGPADGTELDLVRDGETGFMIGRDGEAELLDRMRWAIAHREEMKAMGEAAAAFITRNYTLEIMVDRIEAAVERAAGEAGGARMIPERVKKLLRPIRRRIRILAGADVHFRPVYACAREMHGSDHGGWCVCPEGLGPESVVYSFGIGEDVSFDISLIARYGLRVHAFDPTPKSLAWLKTQILPAGFIPHEYGIAAVDGIAKFFAPDNPDFVSHTMLTGTYGSKEAVEVPVRRLGSIMRELGHARIDILKLDIEGAEYEVLVDILAGDLDIGQILVEFHHRFASVGAEATRQAVARLAGAGYAMFHAAANGEEFSFLKLGAGR